MAGNNRDLMAAKLVVSYPLDGLADAEGKFWIAKGYEAAGPGDKCDWYRLVGGALGTNYADAEADYWEFRYGGLAATTITESFDTIDSSTVGPTLVWSETTGDLSIVTNQLKGVGAVFSEGRAANVLPSSNHYAQIACFHGGSVSAADDVRVLVRCAPVARTHYVASFRCDGSYVIGQRVAGTFTSLTNGSVAWVDGDVLRLEVSGNVLTLKRNGVTVTTYTDTASSVPTGFQVGVAVNLNVVTGDLFQAGTLS